MALWPSPEMGMATRHAPSDDHSGAFRQAFSLWSDPAFLRARVPLVQVSRHAVVFTDASTTGWGATCNGHAAFRGFGRAPSCIGISTASSCLQYVLRCATSICCYAVSTYCSVWTTL